MADSDGWTGRRNKLPPRERRLESLSSTRIDCHRRYLGEVIAESIRVTIIVGHPLPVHADGARPAAARRHDRSTRTGGPDRRQGRRNDVRRKGIALPAPFPRIQATRAGSSFYHS